VYLRTILPDTLFTKGSFGNNGYTVAVDSTNPSNANDYTNLSLGWGKKDKGPLPNVLTHEVMHANDHQQDNLNKKIWESLNTLYNKSKPETNNLPNKQNARQIANISTQTSENFANTLGNIQKRLNPKGDFQDFYSAKKKLPEAINQINNYIARKNSMSRPRGLARKNFIFKSPTPKLGGDSWGDAFEWTNKNPNILSDKWGTSVENYPFYLSFASEFPAFASERLHESWGMQKSPEPEKNFVKSMLEGMSAAYPSDKYQPMNDFINRRRKSIDSGTQSNEIKPPQNQGGNLNPPPPLNQAQGGHIRANRQPTIDLERIVRILRAMSRGMNAQ
jgi:hypothetical protein